MGGPLPSLSTFSTTVQPFLNKMRGLQRFFLFAILVCYGSFFGQSKRIRSHHQHHNKNNRNNNRPTTRSHRPYPSLFSFLSSVVATSVTSETFHIASLHRKLSVDGDAEEEEEEDTEEDIPTTLPVPSQSTIKSNRKVDAKHRDNVGHNASNKIQVAKSKKKSVVQTPSGGDDDDNDNIKPIHDSPSSDGPSFPAVSMMKQFGPTLVYMIASRYISKLDFTNPGIIKLCRIVFAVYLLLSQALFALLKRKIEQTNDTTILQTTSAFSLDTLKAMPGIGEKLTSGPMGMILNSMGGNNNHHNNNSTATTAKKNEQTVKEYDLQELRKLSQAVFFETISASYLHFVTKACKPLLFMPLMGVMNKLQTPLCQIHLLGVAASGALARPFKSGMEEMMSKFMGSAATAAATAGSSESASAEEDTTDAASDADSDVVSDVKVAVSTSRIETDSTHKSAISKDRNREPTISEEVTTTTSTSDLDIGQDEEEEEEEEEE